MFLTSTRETSIMLKPIEKVLKTKLKKALTGLTGLKVD